jgi:hypothetical protein
VDEVPVYGAINGKGLISLKGIAVMPSGWTGSLVVGRKWQYLAKIRNIWKRNTFLLCSSIEAGPGSSRKFSERLPTAWRLLIGPRNQGVRYSDREILIHQKNG